MSDTERIRWARALLFAGWIFVAAYLTLLVIQIRRASIITESRFEDGVWGQRIETVSFATRPQFVLVVVAATAAGVIGLLLVRNAGDPSELALSALVRVVGGMSLLIALLAIVGIIAIFFRSGDSVTDLETVMGRAGGMLIAIACLRLCTEAERSPDPHDRVAAPE